MVTNDEEYSFKILETCDEGLKVCFRAVERTFLKITALTSHLYFNETCPNNEIPPTYTKYIYIYIHICHMVKKTIQVFLFKIQLHWQQSRMNPSQWTWIMIRYWIINFAYEILIKAAGKWWGHSTTMKLESFVLTPHDSDKLISQPDTRDLRDHMGK